MKSVNFFSSYKKFSRNLFLILLNYKQSIKKVDELLSEHVSFLEECYKKDIFIASGRKVPRTGGVILASIEDEEKLKEILEKDPFKKNGIAEYEIIEFIPTKYSPDFTLVAGKDISNRRK